jgi:hypothetical protein
MLENSTATPSEDLKKVIKRVNKIMTDAEAHPKKAFKVPDSWTLPKYDNPYPD